MTNRRGFLGALLSASAATKLPAATSPSRIMQGMVISPQVIRNAQARLMANTIGPGINPRITSAMIQNGAITTGKIITTVKADDPRIWYHIE